MRRKTLFESGLFKEKISAELYKDTRIMNLIFDNSPPQKTSEKLQKFKEHVKSHLFFEDTITDTGTYIFYDIVFPETHENIKRCRIIMYMIAHRDSIETYSLEGYHGNRVDILEELVTDVLLNNKEFANSFGIGPLQLIKSTIYNASRFYGRILEFDVPDFMKAVTRR